MSRAEVTDVAGQASHDAVRRSFKVSDADRNGLLDADEIIPALVECGYNLRPQQAQGIITAFDDSKDGVLDLQEFTKLVECLKFDAGYVIRKVSHAAKKAIDAGQKKRKEFKVSPQLRVDGGAASSISLSTSARTALDDVILRAFKAADADRSGFLDVDEIIPALVNCGYNLHPKKAEAVVAAYDHEPDGVLDFQEFVRLVECLRLDAGYVMRRVNRAGNQPIDTGLTKPKPAAPNVAEEIARCESAVASLNVPSSTPTKPTSPKSIAILQRVRELEKRVASALRDIESIQDGLRELRETQEG